MSVLQELLNELYGLEPDDDSILINEMAMSQKDAVFLLFSLGKPIGQHIIKLLKWDDPQNYAKHIHDIDENWLKKITYPEIELKAQKGTRPVSEEMYYDGLFEYSFETFDQFEKQMKALNKKYGKLPVMNSDEYVWNKLREIIENLSVDLHTGEFNSVVDYLYD